MNYLYVILGIVVIIILYVVYQYLSTSTSTLTNQTSLKTELTVPVTDNPGTNSYSYGLWIYINSVPTSAKYNIFTTNKSKLPPLDLSYNSTTSSTLTCGIYTNSATVPESFQLTNNFPIQKWVYIVINVQNGKYVDFYLDGKLIKSVELTGIQPSSIATDPKSSAVTIGGSTFDALIAGFTRTSTSVNPQDVWSSYLAGNGGNSLSKAFSSYGVNVDLIKDSVTQRTFTLF